jgi:hypothetical protein
MRTESNAQLPLQYTISTLFITLSIILGALLSIQNYNKSSDILLESAHQIYDRLAEELILDIKGTYTPLAGVLNMLSISPISTADTLEQRLEYLKLFSIVLDNYPAAANLQVAYANGDYFIVRHLRSDGLKQKFKTPDSAIFMADNIETSLMGKRKLNRLFFDKELNIIKTEPATDTDYDPRLRPWYIEASLEPVATNPYLFYFSGNVGITAKIKSNQPGVVIATDITLDKLSKTINKYQITPSSEAVLINAKGQTFAYKDPQKLIITSDNNQLKLANLKQLNSEVLSYLSKDIQAVEQNFEFELNGKQWTGSARIIAKPGDVDLFALMVSPVDELLSEAARIRTQSIIVTITITLLFIPLICRKTNIQPIIQVGECCSSNYTIRI